MQHSFRTSYNIPFHNKTGLQSSLVARRSELLPNRARKTSESREANRQKLLLILDEALALAEEMDSVIQGIEHSSM
jgi:hypothetical protein